MPPFIPILSDGSYFSNYYTKSINLGSRDWS
jgi:hypothetical protein